MAKCLCGCGQETKSAPSNDRWKGWIKGKPLRYIQHHAGHERELKFQISKKWLYAKYVTEQLSMREIAVLVGCNTWTIRERLIQYEIPRRPMGWMRGRPMKKNTKKALLESNIGHKHNIGRVLSLETKKKLSIAHIGKKASEATKKLMSEMRRGEKHPNWHGGLSFEPYSPDFNQQLKDRVRVRDNFICQLCRVPELECNRRLAIHHIDYNKNNNSLDNLISLCNSCHTKTNYNRQKWITYFRSKQDDAIRVSRKNTG